MTRTRSNCVCTFESRGTAPELSAMAIGASSAEIGKGTTEPPFQYIRERWYLPAKIDVLASQRANV